MTAIGVMREAYDQNIKIPDDLSVVGFDDIRLAEFTIPPLTTVQMSQHELAKIAFQALLNEVEHDPLSPGSHKYELVTSLVLRRSTALAPDGRQLTMPEKRNRTSPSRKTPAAASR
jgi:LacI family transcriptional regulator